MGRMLNSGMDAQYWEEWSVLGRMLRTRKDAQDQEGCLAPGRLLRDSPPMAASLAEPPLPQRRVSAHTSNLWL